MRLVCRCARLACAAGSLWLAAFALLGAAAEAADEDEDGGSVQDLAYGEVLFHFFQDDYFAALTRLLAADARRELSAHVADAELMRGGLYLSYGQHRLAGEIFERVLADSVDPALHDRAWFFLAKIWYQRGLLAEAEAALGRIAQALPAELEPERRMLEAQVLMAQQRFDRALTVLEGADDVDDEWAAYAKYNVGVALVRLGRVAEGARILDAVGRHASADPDVRALSDRANVAVGYAWLQAAQPAQAKPALARVRLTGPFSNKALLGAGWSEAEQGRFEAALVPWTELTGRSLLDSAVQESLLAVPYAFARLGADGQAADAYVAATQKFDVEIARLEASIAAIEQGELIAALVPTDSADGAGWYWRLEALPERVESRYLYELMSTHRFQEGLKGYRDLVMLKRHFEGWDQSLAAFDDILDTRQRAYEARAPVVDSSLEGVDVERMAQTRIALESRLLEIEHAHDSVALGTPDQQALWRDLEDVERKLALLGNAAQAQELRDKHRFLKGLLQWALERDYKARLWAHERELRELERALSQARRRHTRVANARADWPEHFADLTERIGGLAPRIDALAARIDGALVAQRAYLERIAVEELSAQRERLGAYRVQAQFALAAIYDRAASAPAPAPDRDSGAVAAEDGP